MFGLIRMYWKIYQWFKRHTSAFQSLSGQYVIWSREKSLSSEYIGSTSTIEKERDVFISFPLRGSMKYWHLYAVVHSQLLHQNPDNNIPRGMGKNKAFQYCNLYWKTSKSMWSALYMLNRSIKELNDMPRLLYLQLLHWSWQYPPCAREESSPLSLVCQRDRRTSNGVVTKLSRRSSPCLI